MKFEKFDISDEIKNNLANMGFVKTTDIQFKSIYPILEGEDVLAVAQTGTGKTAAFAIPIIDKIHKQKKTKSSRWIHTLVLVPTRELAQQIGKVFASISKNTRASSYAVYGGIDQNPQIRQLVGGVDILIATPGRMFDLIAQGFINIDKVQVLVLDEADHMLDLGFIEDIEAIKKKLTRYHQTLFFSATINPQIKKLAYKQIRSSAMRIQLSPENLVSRNVTHNLVRVEMDEKRHLLVNFISDDKSVEEVAAELEAELSGQAINKNKQQKKVLVFVRTKVRAERVLAHLTKKAIKAVSLHGGMEQSEREKNLDTFRQSDVSVMIATDVSARGIDLPGITHVINYDLPDVAENYVHRVGRTGRGFAKGEAISFCAPEEYEKLYDIEDFIGTEIKEIKVDKLLYKEALKPADVDRLEIAEMLEFEESFFNKKKK